MGHVTASSGSSINGPPSRAPSSLSSTAFTNFPLISALISFAVAQFIKFFTSWYKERRWDFKRLVGSGGMPSSHSSTVSALAVAIGLQEGFGASVFAVSLILACIVLNQIVYELPAEHPLAESRPLRELLGHTPPQVVAGGLLGIVTSSIGHLMIIMAKP
ncbi:yuiD [Cucurbita argyrosperma subsp. argyrosperma]|nr:yuiD [Cucurbita argyrosperma subsp. argyrosperma]